jgi:hypothetical protein
MILLCRRRTSERRRPYVWGATIENGAATRSIAPTAPETGSSPIPVASPSCRSIPLCTEGCGRGVGHKGDCLRDRCHCIGFGRGLVDEAGIGSRVVTTPPARAGGFLRSSLPRQGLLRRRTLQPATLTPEGSIQAHALDCVPELCFSLCAGGCESDSAGEHLSRQKPAGKRHRFYPVAVSPEPGKPMSHVKVLLQGATTRIACQAGSALLTQPLA